MAASDPKRLNQLCDLAGSDQLYPVLSYMQCMACGIQKVLCASELGDPSKNPCVAKIDPSVLWALPSNVPNFLQGLSPVSPSPLFRNFPWWSYLIISLVILAIIIVLSVGLSKRQ